MYSFDIFDTLITRTTANPEGIFALMQNKLLTDSKYSNIPRYIKENFYDIRINGEKLARKSYQVGNMEDISLDMIYASIASNDIQPKEIELLKELEKNMEYICSIGISENIERLKKYIRDGEKVVLISDMYLDEPTIRNMLVKADSIFKEIPIYVSSMYKKTKGSSNLYWVVKNLELADFSNWVHIGDNKFGDQESARRLGIKTIPYKYNPLTSYEEKVLNSLSNNQFIQLTIGTARNTRLFHKLDKEASIGASLGGIILFPYVFWILQKCLEQGISKLYFIARDGFILKKIADILIHRYSYPISTSYVYGSRRAWRMASFSEANHDINQLLRWSHPNHIKTLVDLAEVFQITEDELKTYLPQNYCHLRRLSNAHINLIQKEIVKNDELWRFLVNKHAGNRETVIKYLKESIDFSDHNIAFVELAGSGYTQMCLANIISDFYDFPIKTFFFKMDSIHNDNKCIFYNFLPSNLHLHVIIEMLCRAPHGQAIGYSLERDKVNPIIEVEEGEALKAHGLLEYIKGVEKFTKEYIKIINEFHLYPLDITLLLEYMRYITHTPDIDLLNFIGGMPNSVTGREKKVIEYAPRLTYKDITNIYLRRTYEPIETYYSGSALSYSVLRCTKRQLRYLEFCQKNHDSIIGKIIRAKKRIIEGKFEKGIKYLIPLEILQKKIVIYAAGNVGQSYYRQLKNSKNHRVVLWVDKKWHEFRKLGLPVSNPMEILNVDYDQIIIAVSDNNLAESIKEDLLNYGINEDKIIWF